MKKRNAFTLVELLVTIAVSSILFLTVASAFYFLVVLNTNTIENSSTAFNVRALRAYIMQDEVRNDLKDAYQNSEDLNAIFVFNPETNSLSYNTKVISHDVPYVSVTFDVNSDDFLVCTITYKRNSRKTKTESLSFVVVDVGV